MINMYRIFFLASVAVVLALIFRDREKQAEIARNTVFRHVFRPLTAAEMQSVELLIKRKNGDCMVLTGTVVEKLKKRYGRGKRSYFRLRDADGIEETYCVYDIHTYNRAEMGSRCLVFSYPNEEKMGPLQRMELARDVVLL